MLGGGIATCDWVGPKSSETAAAGVAGLTFCIHGLCHPLCRRGVSLEEIIWGDMGGSTGLKKNDIIYEWPLISKSHLDSVGQLYEL